MVTPLAQFVGSQAAINVITGERYKEVTAGRIQYALRALGQRSAGGDGCDLKDKILGRPRFEDLVRMVAAGSLARANAGKNLARRVCRMKNWCLRVIAGGLRPSAPAARPGPQARPAGAAGAAAGPAGASADGPGLATSLSRAG